LTGQQHQQPAAAALVQKHPRCCGWQLAVHQLPLALHSALSCFAAAALNPRAAADAADLAAYQLLLLLQLADAPLLGRKHALLMLYHRQHHQQRQQPQCWHVVALLAHSAAAEQLLQRCCAPYHTAVHLQILLPHASLRLLRAPAVHYRQLYFCHAAL
jgi:hypothetical protein